MRPRWRWGPAAAGQSLGWLQEQQGRTRSVQTKPSHLGAGAQHLRQCRMDTVLLPDTQLLPHAGENGARSPQLIPASLLRPQKSGLCRDVQRATLSSNAIRFPDVAQVDQKLTPRSTCNGNQDGTESVGSAPPAVLSHLCKTNGTCTVPSSAEPPSRAATSPTGPLRGGTRQREGESPKSGLQAL